MVYTSPQAKNLVKGNIYCAPWRRWNIKCLVRFVLTWVLNCVWNTVCSLILLNFVLKNSVNTYAVTLCFESKLEVGESSCPAKRSVINYVNCNTLGEGKVDTFNGFNYKLCLAVGRFPVTRILTIQILYIPLW